MIFQSFLKDIFSIFTDGLYSALKKMIRIISILLMLISCNSKRENANIESYKHYSKITDHSDSLFIINDSLFEQGSSCGYVNKQGTIIIPNETFDMCFTDTFATFAYVLDKELYGDGVVAINRNKEIIFDAYLFDNGTDNISDGLFRIKRNGKIGYANEIGEIIIEPKYVCAYPFENGRAKVAYDCKTIKDETEYSSWESSHWFYIDKNGNKIK